MVIFIKENGHFLKFFFRRPEMYLSVKSYVIRNGVKNCTKRDYGTPHFFSSKKIFWRFSIFLTPKNQKFSGLAWLHSFLVNFTPQTRKSTPNYPYFTLFGGKIGYMRRLNLTLRVGFNPRIYPSYAD